MTDGETGQIIEYLCAPTCPAPARRAVTIVLPGERPVSWNSLYASRHWAVRKAAADNAHAAVMAACSVPPVEPFAALRVDILVYALFDKRPYDSDNIPAKLYIDGLRAAGVLDNDTIRYVRYVATCAAIDADNPRVEIEIREVEE